MNLLANGLPKRSIELIRLDQKVRFWSRGRFANEVFRRWSENLMCHRSVISQGSVPNSLSSADSRMLRFSYSVSTLRAKSEPMLILRVFRPAEAVSA